MHPDRDFDLAQAPPVNEADLAHDLELDTLLHAMALGDPFLLEVARTALGSGLRDPQAIVYRHHVLADCLEHSAAIRGIYDLAVEGLAAEKTVRLGWLRDTPDSLLHGSVQVLDLLVGILRRLRQTAEEHAHDFHSEGLVRLCGMLVAELEDGYLDAVERHLRELRFRRGVLISARLGKGGRGAEPVVHT